MRPVDPVIQHYNTLSHCEENGERRETDSTTDTVGVRDVGDGLCLYGNICKGYKDVVIARIVLVEL